jgi:hypothetical protein
MDEDDRLCATNITSVVGDDVSFNCPLDEKETWWSKENKKITAGDEGFELIYFKFIFTKFNFIFLGL